MDGDGDEVVGGANCKLGRTPEGAVGLGQKKMENSKNNVSSKKGQSE